MIEETGGMEKKNYSRQSPVPCRNAVSEKKSDIQPRGNGQKRRGGSNGARKNQEPHIRQAQSRGRGNSDQRQRPRNSYGNRQREEIVEEECFEDVVSTRFRKGNGNFLLNFFLEPRSFSYRHDSYGSFNHRRSSNVKRDYAYIQKQQQRYMQANCQFVVHDSDLYTEQAVDPDKMVHWENVELVRSRTTEMVKCPICLEVPFAGKITKCGHVFCWACILHHFQLSDSKTAGCPVCKNEMKLDDLRSAQLLEVPEFKVGDTIKLKLMRKSRGSTFIAPVMEWEDRKGKPVTIGDKNKEFSKVLLASQKQIETEVIDSERASLVAQTLDAEESEKFFIEMANEMLEKRLCELRLGLNLRKFSYGEVKIPGLVIEEPADSNVKKCSLTSPTQSLVEHDKSLVMEYNDAFQDEVFTEKNTQNDTGIDTADEHTAESTYLSSSTDSNTENCSAEDSTLGACGGVPGPTTSTPDIKKSAKKQLSFPEPRVKGAAYSSGRAPCRKEYQHFYQASTGQHIYLSQLNYKCLIKEYEQIENCPQEISASIVAITGATMDEKLRANLRYLNHLPLGCEFNFVELKLGPPILNEDTLAFFHDEMEGKRKERQRKLKEENRTLYKSNMEHNRCGAMATYEADLQLNNLQDFPSHLEAAGSPPDRSNATILSHPEDTSKPFDSDSDKEDKPKTKPWPGNNPTNASQSSVNYARIAAQSAGRPAPTAPIWVRAPVQGYGLPATDSIKTHTGDDEEGYRPPDLTQSWLESASNAFSRYEKQTTGETSSEACKDGKKKGKNKKKTKFNNVLMQTVSMRKH